MYTGFHNMLIFIYIFFLNYKNLIVCPLTRPAPPLNRKTKADWVEIHPAIFDCPLVLCVNAHAPFYFLFLDQLERWREQAL